MSTRQSKTKEIVSNAPTVCMQMASKRKGVPKRKTSTPWQSEIGEILADLQKRGITIEQAAVNALLMGVEDAASEFSNAEPDRVAKRLKQLETSKAPKRHYNPAVVGASINHVKINTNY